MRKTMTHEELELNGCYAMLCEALRAWYRLQHDHTRELAAKTLKDVYGYEFHLNGGGCPWRLPSVDHEWAVTCSRHLTASRSEVGASCSRLVSESVSTGYSRAPHGSR